MAKIAVHVVTYNNAETIEICLNSLLAQRNITFEVLVIDNASHDDTVKRVQSLGVPVITNESNAGYSKAHNQALALTASEYVLTLNPDLWLDPFYLYHLAQTLDANPHIGSASGRLLRVEQLGEPPHSVDSTGLFMRRNRRQGLRNEGHPIAACPTQPRLIFGPDGAAAFYRRTMLEDIRVMDEVFDNDFFIQKEDVDVCWRAQLRGWSALYVPEATAHHIRSFRAGQRYRRAVSKRMRFYAVRNRYLLMMKNEIREHFWRDFLAIAMYDLGIVIYIVLRERESWPALRAALKMRKYMLQKRHLIQSSRRVNRQYMSQWFE